MSLNIPANIILEKNKLFSTGSFVELLEWQVSETSETVRVANHNEDVVWNGETWSKFRFEGGGESDTGGDSAETLEIKVSAIDRVIQGHLEDLTNGGIGDTVIYRRVSTKYLEVGAALTATFEIVNIDAGPDNEWVIFSLGQQNFFLSQFPANVFRRNICRYRPTLTSVCSYVNNVLCDRTFGSCIHFGQTSVFGGQPGIPGGAFNVPVLWSITSTTAALDAILYDPTGEAAVSLDSLLSKAFTSTVSLDAVLIKSTSALVGLDAILVDSPTYISLPIDALLSKAQSSAASLQALLFEAKTLTSALDALLYEEKSASAVLNALLIKPQSSTSALDALLFLGDGSTSVQLDALLSKSSSSMSALDALLTDNSYIDSQLDALLLGSVSSTASMDAIIVSGEGIEDTSGTVIEDTSGTTIEDTAG